MYSKVHIFKVSNWVNFDLYVDVLNITTIKIINLTITPSLLFNSAYECIGPFAFPFQAITDLLCITINLLFLENCIMESYYVCSFFGQNSFT